MKQISQTFQAQRLQGSSQPPNTTSAILTSFQSQFQDLKQYNKKNIHNKKHSNQRFLPSTVYFMTSVLNDSGDTGVNKVFCKQTGTPPPYVHSQSCHSMPQTFRLAVAWLPHRT